MQINKPYRTAPPCISQSWYCAAAAAQNKVLAGVFRPMNELVWRSSILNLAKRNAENTAMRKANREHILENCSSSRDT